MSQYGGILSRGHFVRFPNEISFRRDNCVVQCNIALDRGPVPSRQGKIWGSEPAVRSESAYWQITLAVVIQLNFECGHSYRTIPLADRDMRNSLGAEIHNKSYFRRCCHGNFPYGAAGCPSNSTPPTNIVTSQSRLLSYAGSH